jgi:hypothetical protein
MITKSDRTKSLEETQIDKEEDLMTRGIRSGIKNAALVASRVGDVAATGADMAAKYLKKKEPKNQGTFEDFIKSAEQEANEAKDEKKRETRGVKKPLFQKFKSGGKVSSASKRADGCAQKGKTKGRMI